MTPDATESGGKGQERRSKRRYQVTMRADFRWQDIDGSWHRGSGTTQNISSEGVFILADCTPPLGAVKLAVAVPPVRRNATGKIRLFGKGIVLRVIPKTGFAMHVSLRLSNCPDNGENGFL